MSTGEANWYMTRQLGNEKAVWFCVKPFAIMLPHQWWYASNPPNFIICVMMLQKIMTRTKNGTNVSVLKDYGAFVKDHFLRDPYWEWSEGQQALVVEWAQKHLAWTWSLMHNTNKKAKIITIVKIRKANKKILFKDIIFAIKENKILLRKGRERLDCER